MSIPTPDYPDWTSPVAQVEHIATLLNTSQASVYLSPVMDCSSFGHLDLVLASHGGVFGESIWQVNVYWMVGADTIATDIISLVFGVGGNTVSGEQLWQLPIKAPSFQLGASDGGTGQQLDITIYGSSRDIPAQSYISQQEQVGKLIESVTALSIPAHTTSSFYLPPVASAYRVFIGGAASGPIYSLLCPWWLAGPPALVRVQALPQPASDTVTTLFGVPNSGARFDCINITAGALSTTFALWTV